MQFHNYYYYYIAAMTYIQPSTFESITQCMNFEAVISLVLNNTF